MHLALFQPEIPQNVGTLIRLGACMDTPIDIIEPCGFIWHTPRLRRAGMDYLDLATVERHKSWEEFEADAKKAQSRLILLDTKGTTPYLDFKFEEGDTLVAGQESSGVPDNVFAACDEAIYIPMSDKARSLNVAVASAIVLSEAIRQCRKK